MLALEILWMQNIEKCSNLEVLMTPILAILTNHNFVIPEEDIRYRAAVLLNGFESIDFESINTEFISNLDPIRKVVISFLKVEDCNKLDPIRLKEKWEDCKTHLNTELRKINTEIQYDYDIIGIQKPSWAFVALMSVILFLEELHRQRVDILAAARSNLKVSYNSQP